MCVVCGSDAGVPNVRAAQRDAERAALEIRYSDAEEAAKANGLLSIFAKFRVAADGTVAVVCRNLSILKVISGGDNALYGSYHHQVDAHVRIPELNNWDQKRESLESALFPGYYREICFGALSFTGLGLTAYGDFSIVLKDHTISKRASVFNSPIFRFFRDQKVVFGDDIPDGFRATWQDRGKLAVAKLGARLDAKMDVAEFQSLMLEAGTSTESDCIEVHIYGPIHRRAIEKVIGKRPPRKADRIIFDSAARELRQIGVAIECVP